MSFKKYSESRLPLFENFLEDSLETYRKTSSLRFGPLIEAMAYSLDGGGKRFRPLLVLASGECLGLNPEDLLPAASAMEYIHTYSLIHDDLPALDDDDMRRGKASSHKKFGEAVAILAGDALLTEAFGQILQLGKQKKFEPAGILAAIEQVSLGAGVRGMVGGQFIDVTTEQTQYTLPEVEFIHIHKTGALIVAAVLLPAKLSGLEESRSRLLRRYGEALGLAFQISDDILDAESDTRYSRGPQKKTRPAYSELMTRTEMQELLNGLVDTAITSVQGFGVRAKHLVDIAEFIRTRKS